MTTFELVSKLHFECFAQIIWSQDANLLLIFFPSRKVLYCRVYSICLRLICIQL